MKKNPNNQTLLEEETERKIKGSNNNKPNVSSDQKRIITANNSKKKKMNLSYFLQLPPNVIIAKFLPSKLLQLYVRLLGLLYFSVNRKDKLMISFSHNYILKSHLKPKSIFLSKIKTYLGIFDHYYEKLLIGFHPLSELWNKTRSKYIIKNQDWLERVRESGKGGIMVTAHLGAVEFIPLIFIKKGLKLAIVTAFKTPQHREAVMSKAKEYDQLIIDAKQPKIGIRAVNAIKNGRILLTINDEFKHWRVYPDKFISVFGHKFPRDRALDDLYSRVNVPVSVGILSREKGKYIFNIEPISKEHEDDYISIRVWKTIEKYILKYPEQWFIWNELTKLLSSKNIKK